MSFLGSRIYGFHITSVQNTNVTRTICHNVLVISSSVTNLAEPNNNIHFIYTNLPRFQANIGSMSTKGPSWCILDFLTLKEDNSKAKIEIQEKKCSDMQNLLQRRWIGSALMIDKSKVYLNNIK